MSWIQKYILPKEVDFNTSLQRQIDASKHCITDLSSYCKQGDQSALKAILEDEHQSRALKSQNMAELLDVFITPYDKESIYRIITKLDWIALSVKHLAIKLKAYQVSHTDCYHEILDHLEDMMQHIESAFQLLPKKKLSNMLTHIETVHDQYDNIFNLCTLAGVQSLENNDVKAYLVQKEMLQQLKNIAMHIHLTANTLEDMAMKVV